MIRVPKIYEVVFKTKQRFFLFFHRVDTVRDWVEANSLQDARLFATMKGEMLRRAKGSERHRWSFEVENVRKLMSPYCTRDKHCPRVPYHPEGAH